MGRITQARLEKCMVEGLTGDQQGNVSPGSGLLLSPESMGVLVPLI